MSGAFTILVADRNPHVRALLKRELSVDGCKVRLAATSDEVLDRASRPDPPDLIIMDPDLPGITVSVLFELLRKRRAGGRVVVHGHFSRASPREACVPAEFIKVEKNAGSAELLKHVARFILQTDSTAV